MNILVVYAHPNPQSFNYAILEEFTKGLKDGGHSFEVVDLYAIKFDPSISLADFAQFTGQPMPQDVLAQQEKLSQSDAIVLIGPILGWFVPAIMEGWMQRVFSYGYAWKADEKGIKGLLNQKKALFISTTGIAEDFYKSTGLGDAMEKIMAASISETGIKNVETVFFYLVAGVDDTTRKKYLEKAYQLGKAF